MLSRRRFLQAAGAGALGALLPARAQEPIFIGRAVDYVSLLDAPSFLSGTKIKSFRRDDLIPIYETLEAEGGYNRTWYRTEGGYVYSTNVVPMQPYAAPPPLMSHLGEWGKWAQVVAPWSDSRTEPHAAAQEMYRIYYDTVHHVVEVQRDEAGTWWYRIQDARYDETYWAQAEHLRVLSPGEFAPIRPEVKDKRIEISLATHYLLAYEGDEQVFEGRVSSGTVEYWEEDNSTNYFETPPGRYRVMLKAPARHMGSRGTLGSFDYPGVPWNTFFTDTGLAMHGTYWHNDFGTKRSHGCINMRPEDALWVFRWTAPAMPYEAETLPVAHDAASTPVIVY